MSSLACYLSRAKPLGRQGALRSALYSSSSSSSSSSYSPVALSEEVRYALQANIPVVALESTIISHGMPYPRNLEVALQVEAAVREGGAVPATVAVIDGVPKVGLSKDEITLLADCKNKGISVMKASRRDLAFACAQRRTAATTVASTMILSHLAGVKVFATGGIGGVHRGAEVTMDISADLMEFKQTPVTVVCAGVKSILDIPKTLEVLETQGVPVLGLGCKDFPAFFTNDSGIRAPQSVDSTLDIAKMMVHSDLLRLNCGMVVGVPNPNPADGQVIQAAIQAAIASAEANHITGAAVTPYILSFVEKATGGKSLDANIALVLNNAKTAARIASEYNHLRSQGGNDNGKTVQYSFASSQSSRSSVSSPEGGSSTTKAPSSAVMVFGGAVIDNIGRPKHGQALIKGSSNPGIMTTTFGGVGRNIADLLATTSDGATKVSLVSVVADDISGKSLLDDSRRKSIEISKVLVHKHQKSHGHSGKADKNGEITKRTSFSTASYTAIHDEHGDLNMGIADMDIFGLLSGEYVNGLASSIRQEDLVVCDGNISAEAFAAVARICDINGVPLFFEPTSDHKCILPLLANSINKIDITKPNFSELVVMIKKALDMGLIVRNKASLTAAVAQVEEKSYDASSVDLLTARLLATGLLNLMLTEDVLLGKQSVTRTTIDGKRRVVRGKHVLLSMGARGVLWCGSRECFGKSADAVIDDFLAYKLVPAIPVENVSHTSGAGDAFCAGLLGSIVGETARGAIEGGPQIIDVENGIKSAHRRICLNNSQ